jgi:hypothetical protein
MDKGFWVDECNYPAVPYSFWETARTEEYVELYEPVWNHWIRLYATRAERKTPNLDFRLLSGGGWGEDSVAHGLSSQSRGGRFVNPHAPVTSLERVQKTFMLPADDN